VSLILSVNPGATSTKVGLFEGGAPREVRTLRHGDAELAAHPRIADQLALRLAAVRAFLAERGVASGDLAAVAGRGGLLRPLPSGTYRVDAALLADAARAERGEHASNLGGPMAAALAGEHRCPAFVVDPVSVDELRPVARVSGLAGVERQSLAHALNIKAVARRHAQASGRPLSALRLVVAHMGSGVSMAALEDGRMVDVVNPQDEGPMSPDRAGGLPATAVVELCFAPGAEKRAVQRRLFGDGGLYSHLGTRDLAEALSRMERGDALARRVLEAMAYQIAKAAASLAAVLRGQVDALLLTGGMAHAAWLVEAVRSRLEWIGPVAVYPGEDELLALAEGAARVLAGEEEERGYGEAPAPEQHVSGRSRCGPEDRLRTPVAPQRPPRPALSAVVPLFNEAGHAVPFLAALRARLDALTDQAEIVVVNDGSRDRTREEVLEAAAALGIHYLELSRNFGKEAALAAGLERARGQVVLLLDGDGQHPLDVIPVMLARWQAGDDMVYGVHRDRSDETLTKRVGASAFYRVLSLGARVPIPRDAGDFRLLDRKVVEALRRLPERARFMKGLYAWVGFRSSAVPFTPLPRAGGRSAFRAIHLVRLALDGLTAFTTLPLRALSLTGAVMSAAALAYGAWVAVEELIYDIPVPGYPTIVVSIMFFSGVQLLSLGVIGEYLGRIFEEVKRRPNFLVGDQQDHSPLRGEAKPP